MDVTSEYGKYLEPGRPVVWNDIPEVGVYVRGGDEGWCYVKWPSEPRATYELRVCLCPLCRECLRGRSSHDEHTNKCLFGAGKWR